MARTSSTHLVQDCREHDTIHTIDARRRSGVDGSSSTFTVSVKTQLILDFGFDYLGNGGLVNALSKEFVSNGSLSVFTSKADAQCCNDGPGAKKNKRLTVAQCNAFVALANEYFGQ